MLTIRPDAWPWYIDLKGMNLAVEDGINARFTDVFGVGLTGDELIAPQAIHGPLRARSSDGITPA